MVDEDEDAVKEFEGAVLDEVEDVLGVVDQVAEDAGYLDEELGGFLVFAVEDHTAEVDEDVESVVFIEGVDDLFVFGDVFDGAGGEEKEGGEGFLIMNFDGFALVHDFL